MPDSFQFHFPKPSVWTGRLPPAGIAAGEAALALRLGERGFWPVLEWPQPGRSELCPAASSLAIYSLVESLLDTYEWLSAQASGPRRSRQDLGSLPFYLNEFGQVLVGLPGEAGGRGSFFGLAGEAEGVLHFVRMGQAPTLIDLSEDDALSAGDPWTQPALGIPYYLSRRTHVYFQHADGRQSEPPQQDWELCEGLRDFYPSGPLRFLVNPYGIALAPGPAGQGWLYMGRIRKEYWFEKED